MRQAKLINDIIGYEPLINVGVTSPGLKKIIEGDKTVEVIGLDLNEKKRFYHFILCDTNKDPKALFRALRNGGYLISTVKMDHNTLYDIGFSAISEMEGLLIAKKVHSWNDW